MAHKPTLASSADRVRETNAHAAGHATRRVQNRNSRPERTTGSHDSHHLARAIETIINNFDINVCSVAMRLRGDGDHKYVVSPEDAAAIQSRTMWLRSSYYTRPDEKRVEKYLSRGFTLVADPAIPWDMNPIEPLPPTRNVHILVYFLVPYTTLAAECFFFAHAAVRHE